MEVIPDWYPKRENILHSDETLSALKQAWLNVHATRFQRKSVEWYMAVRMAEAEISSIAGVDTLGYSFGWISEL